MTVYETVKNMTKEEFSRFMFQLYNKGWNDSHKGEDDELWVFYRLADCSMEEWEQAE